MATKKQKGKAVSLTYYIAASNGDVRLCCNPPGYDPSAGGKFLVGDVERGVGVEELTFDELRERDPITAMKVRPYAFPVEEVAKQFPAIAEELRERAAQFRQEQAPLTPPATNAPPVDMCYDTIAKVFEALFAGSNVDIRIGEPTPIKAMRTRAKDWIYTILTVTLAGETKGILLRLNKFDEYDRKVYHAVISQFEGFTRKNAKGNLVFDSVQQYRAMTGRDDSPTPAQVFDMDEAIRCMKRIEVGIDATEEYNYRLGHTYKAVIQYRPMLKIRRTQTVSNTGVIRFVYELEEVPPLWLYAKTIRQYRAIPIELLDTRQVLNGKLTQAHLRNYDRKIAFESYLWRRVGQMRYLVRTGKKANTDVLYSTVFTAAGIVSSEQSRDQRATDVKLIGKVLEYMKAIGYIIGYKADTDKDVLDKHGQKIRTGAGRPQTYKVTIKLGDKAQIVEWDEAHKAGETA